MSSIERLRMLMMSRILLPVSVMEVIKRPGLLRRMAPAHERGGVTTPRTWRKVSWASLRPASAVFSAEVTRGWRMSSRQAARPERARSLVSEHSWSTVS